MFEGCVRGLAYLHANQVIHRDIKPGNILVVNGVAKISDFGGCATTLGRKLPYEHNIVTSYWRPPELFYEEKGKYAYSYEVDVWSMLVVGLDVVFDLYEFGMDIYQASQTSKEALFKVLKRYGCYVPAKYKHLATGQVDADVLSLVKVYPENQPFVDFIAAAIAAAPSKRPTSERLLEAVLEALRTSDDQEEYLAFHEAAIAYGGVFTEELRAEAMLAFGTIFDKSFSTRVELLAIDIFDRASTVINDSKEDLRLNVLASVFLAADILGYEGDLYQDLPNFDLPGFGEHLGKVLKAINFHVYRPDLITALGLSEKAALTMARRNLSAESVKRPIPKRTPARKPVTKKPSKARLAAAAARATYDERDASPRRLQAQSKPGSKLGSKPKPKPRAWWQPQTPTETPILMY